jgi:SAM-dependent methyltransferase
MPALEKSESPGPEAKRQWVLNVIHRFVAIPAIYDAAQIVAGVRQTRAVLKNLVADLPLETVSVLDIGGGTGLLRALFPAKTRYTCLDNDPQKLRGFRAKNPDCAAIEGSSTRIPARDGTFDLAIICAMTHHLADDDLRATVDEAARVLRPEGHLLFLDALWEPRRLRGRILWRLDRGDHPRTYDALREAFTRRFTIVKESRWAVHHAYVGWLLASGRNATTE